MAGPHVKIGELNSGHENNSSKFQNNPLLENQNALIDPEAGGFLDTLDPNINRQPRSVAEGA